MVEVRRYGVRVQSVAVIEACQLPSYNRHLNLGVFCIGLTSIIDTIKVNARGRTAEHNTATKYEQCISLELRILAENSSKKRKIRLIRLCNIVKHFQYLFYLSSLPYFIRYILYILHIKYGECRHIHVHARLNR